MRCVMGESGNWRLSTDHSGGGLRINFLPADAGCCMLGTKVGFTASVVTAIPWVAPCLGPGLFRAIPIKPASGVIRGADITGGRHWYWSLRAAFSVLAIVALCVAAIGFIAVQPCSGRCRHSFFPVRRWLRGLVYKPVWCSGRVYCPDPARESKTLFSSDAAGLLTLAAVAVIVR